MMGIVSTFFLYLFAVDSYAKVTIMRNIMATNSEETNRARVSWWIPADEYQQIKDLAEYEFQAGGKINVMALVLIREALETRKKKGKSPKREKAK